MNRTFLGLLLVSGCVIGGDRQPRPRDLPSSTVVDRLRLLAIVAEPPEARPGEAVSFEALLADPTGADPLVAWLACPPEAASGLGCVVDLSALSPDATPEELAEMGVIGFEPGFPPAYTPEPDILAGLDDAAKLEGLTVTIEVAAFPAAILAGDPENIDFSAVETGYKRLVVSEATTPNHNPTIADFTIDGFVVPPGAVAEIDVGQAYELGVVLPEEAIESYEFTNSEGIVEARVEEPYVDWYCTTGTLPEAYTLHPYTQADFIAPAEAGPMTCYAVARDRRGGMAWRTQEFLVR